MTLRSSEPLPLMVDLFGSVSVWQTETLPRQNVTFFCAMVHTYPVSAGYGGRGEELHPSPGD